MADGAVLFFDTVTLSNFRLAGRLDLLITRYGARARVTPEVLDEVTDGVVAGFAESCGVLTVHKDGVVAVGSRQIVAAS